MPTLHLASQSPRRRELLQQVGVSFELLSLSIDETPWPDEAIDDYVLRAAKQKAAAGVEVLASPDAVVLAADTVGRLNQTLLLKPRDKHHSAAMLRSLSGEWHTILTAICLRQGGREASALVKTQVQFRHLNDVEIDAYWETQEPQDKAGSYAIQGFGAVFVEQIQGSYSNVVGLPLLETAQLLSDFGVPVWQPRENM